MDDNPADQTARQWLSRSSAGDEKDAEIARLRERLAFYQSFEGLIQDNIARSGDLLLKAEAGPGGAVSLDDLPAGRWEFALEDVGQGILLGEMTLLDLS